MQYSVKHKRPRGAVAFIGKIKPYWRSLALFNDPKAYCAYCSLVQGYKQDEKEVSEIAGQSFLHDSKRWAIYVHKVAAPGVLAHELGHVIIKLFDDICLQINHGSAEAFTYLMQELFDELYPALYDVRLKQRRKPCTRTK